MRKMPASSIAFKLSGGTRRSISALSAFFFKIGNSAVARAKPDGINFGSWGVGSFSDLYRAWLENKFNVTFRHIPYKEANQATAGLLTGEVQVLLANLGPVPFTVRRGMRIAQMVVAKIEQVVLREGTLNETARGTGGFGSTGHGIEEPVAQALEDVQK